MTRRVLALLVILTGIAGGLIASGPANAIPVTGYYSIGYIKAVGSNMCLELVSNHPDQKIDWAPCGGPLEIWHAQIILRSGIIYYANNPNICMDGGPHAGEYLYSYDCSEHTKPTSGIIIYGGFYDGAKNAIRSVLTGRYVTFSGGVGPATWAKGRNLLQRIIAGIRSTQQVEFVGGWIKVTVE